MLAVAPVKMIVPLLAGNHHVGRFPPREKSRQTSHFPDFGKDPRRRLANAELDVGADVEDDHGNRPDVPFDGCKQVNGFSLGPRIDAEGMRLAPSGPDRLGNGFELLQIAGPPGDADRHAFTCESPGDCAADAIACADYQAHVLARWLNLLGLLQLPLLDRAVPFKPSADLAGWRALDHLYDNYHADGQARCPAPSSSGVTRAKVVPNRGGTASVL